MTTTDGKETEILQTKCLQGDVTASFSDGWKLAHNAEYSRIRYSEDVQIVMGLRDLLASSVKNQNLTARSSIPSRDGASVRS